MSRGYGSVQRSILAAVAADGPLTTPELVEVTGASEDSVRRAVRGLAADGAVTVDKAPLQRKVPFPHERDLRMTNTYWVKRVRLPD